MNRLRRTKKVKEPVESEPTGFMSTAKFKKNKATDDAPAKPALDLEHALPSDDNFRTSLLMPNLSARFSMLREQDDPTSKLGKANDDSVLFPKRQSRLNLFGHNPSALADIAEVASIGRSSFNMNRTDEMGRSNSYASADDFTDDSSTHGGIMNRKRPGEGNNLFGGRQKVYKIPVSSSGKESVSKGKSVYEDDIHLSAFQKLRLKEKEDRARLAEEGRDATTTEHDDSLPSFLAKRTTSSSTTSGNSNPRTSTAATSIDEQVTSNSQATSNGPPPSPTKKSSWVPPTLMGHVSKTRRLYGQNQEQPPSPFNRFDNLSRQNSGAGTPELPRLNRTFSRSATNLGERHQRFSPVQPPPAGSRTFSPPAPAHSPQLDTTDGHQQDQPLASTTSSIPSSAYGVVPPLSPPVSDNEEISALNAHLQPEDRGKATAMGLFNKPSGPFDEQQFMRRQLQMHEGRNTPPVMTRPSPSNSVSRPEPPRRSRGLSNASYRSKAESVSSRYSDDVPGSRAHSVRDYSPPRAGTFMLNLDASDSEDFAGEETSARRAPSTKAQAFDGIHPAFRSRPTSRDSDVAYPPRDSVDFPELKYPDRDLNPIQETSPPSPILEEAPERTQDSPTLGPTGLGLSSMIRTHLRHDSAQSSVLPVPPPAAAPVQQVITPFSLDTSPGPPAQAQSSTANNDGWVSPKTEMQAPPHPPPEPPASGFSSVALRAKQLRDQAAALRDQTNQPRDSGESDRLTEMPAATLPAVSYGHRRGSSTETQKEREEFAHELAERRRRVQESLNRIDSRSNSPASGRHTPDVGSGRTSHAFSVLKSRAGRSSPPDRSIPATRALKKLGMGASPSSNSSTPSLDSWRDDEMYPGLGKHSNSSSPQIGAGRMPRPFRGTTSRSTSYGSQEDPDRAPSRTASPARQRDPRDRSTSASGRSKSRPRPRDDLAMVAEDTISRYDRANTPSHGSPVVSARPSVDTEDSYARERPGSSMSSAEGGLSRSSSRAPAPGRVKLPDQHPRPSPFPAYSANTTPPLEDPDMGTSYMSSHNHSIPQRSPTSTGLTKRQIDKSQISEPTFVSSTSNVPIVDLPASNSTGAEGIPPVPPMNPRRKRTGTQTMASNLPFRPQTAPSHVTGETGGGVRSRQGTLSNYPPPPAATSVEGGMI